MINGEFMNNDYSPEDWQYWLNDDDEDFLYWGEDPDDEDSTELECGFVSGYGCQLAGTEECDWECSYSHKLRNHPILPKCFARSNLRTYTEVEFI